MTQYIDINKYNTIGHRGWNQFSKVFSGDDGVIYAVKGGDLQWRKDLARNGSESWAAGNGNTIGHNGWDQFSQLFSGGDGVIYAIRIKGDDLEWRKDLARNGSESWAAGNGNTIGHNGWGRFLWVFSGGDGVIYAVTPEGNLEWRKDLARNGSESWAAGNGNTIWHGGWDRFNNVFSGGNGVIYAVDGDANLRRYQDLNRNGGESWAQSLDPLSNTYEGFQTIGLAGPQRPFAGGWNNFRQLFSGGNGVIYAVDGDHTEGNLRWYRDLN